ncbi:MAG: hypothetical protein ACOYBY_17585 [Dermatophilaceae bacterium]
MDHSPTHEARSATESEHYEIRVKGHLAPRWAGWFDGLTLTAQDDGTTVIRGLLADQSELHGLLRRLGDLGLPLISLTPIDPSDPAHSEGARHDH